MASFVPNDLTGLFMFMHFSFRGAVIATLFWLLAAGARADEPAPARRYVLDSQGNRPTPRIIVPDVCAWPYTVQLADGTILAAIFNQPSHGRMVGDVDIWATTDGGQTWGKRGTGAPHEPGAPNNRMNCAIGLDAGGNVVLLSSGWSLKPHPTTQGALEIDKVLRTWVCRSDDGGKTWTLDKESFPENSPEGTPLIPFGSVAIAKDGSLVTAAYTTIEKEKKWWQSYAVRSSDGGKTWTVGVPIDPTRALNETFLWHDGNGRWIAVGRHSRLELYESTDDARTWKHLCTATENNCVPGMIIKLADGRLLLSHGNRIKGSERVDLRVSDDGGKSWSQPARLVDFITFDGGYPSSVQRPDGQIVTAYYAKKTEYHDGYHMGVVIWDPVKTFPKQ